jgi:P4 family phage/plasmid primase-like protien
MMGEGTSGNGQSPPRAAWDDGPPPGRFDEHDDAVSGYVDAPVPRIRSATGPCAKVVDLWLRGDHVELAERLVARLEEGGRHVVMTEGVFWRYDVSTGLWLELELDEMWAVLHRFAGARIPAADGSSRPLKIRAADIKGSIEIAQSMRAARKGYFDDVPAGIAFKDGFLRVTKSGVSLEPLSAEVHARHGYAFASTAREGMAEWLRFLAALFRDDADAAEKMAFLQEFFGAALLGVATRYQRALFATGTGRNGKSTLFAILRSVFTPRTVTEVPPHALRDDYARATLAGKLLNIVAETPTRELLDTESFKALVTGDPLQARHPYGRKFTLHPKAAHAFAPQELPDVADKSDGFWRRPVVVEFNRKFEGAEDHEGLATELAESARPAIVAWLVEGAERLIGNHRYTLPSSHETALARWRLANNNIALFASERLVRATAERPEGAHDWTPGSALYASYREWATDGGYRPVAANTFARGMQALGHTASHTRRGHLYPVRAATVYDA